MKHSIKRGFTLIEILIVLVILALLAALLLPVFSRARESARTASCASNLRQIGQAITLYVQDNNQRFPLAVQPLNCTWVDTIYPYAKSTKVFSCPAAQHGEYVPGCGPAEPLTGGDVAARYGFNGSYDMVVPFVEVSSVTDADGGTTSNYSVPTKSISLSKYRFPSNTILVLDGSDDAYLFHNTYAVINPGVDPIHSVEDLKDGGVLPRHNDGVNLLYVDGHVKWQNLKSLASTPMWRYDGREPNPVSPTAPIKTVPPNQSFN